MKVDPKWIFFHFFIRKKHKKPELLLPAMMVSPKKQKNILYMISDLFRPVHVSHLDV